MPPRKSARNANRHPSSSPATQIADDGPTTVVEDIEANLTLLRRQWKWAAFCQFFYIFDRVFNMPDIAISEIEDDLVRSSALVLPKIIVRLIHTLSHDKKTNLDNWQTSLRRQYARRKPDADPLAPEPQPPSEYSSPEPEVAPSPDAQRDATSERPESAQPDAAETEPTAKTESPASPKVEQVPTLPEPEEDNRPVDWMQLPMLEKLDTLHLLQEWQFMNDKRLKQIMRDDNEDASWRIEPIGYDAKTNAYWLIGPDRLWIQRAPPRPQTLKRKRAPAKQASRKAARTGPPPKVAAPAIVNRTASGRSSRSKASSAPSGRGARAAKLQANIKLDQQAKQLEAFQKEATGRATRSAKAPSSPPKAQPRGTRLSARLRGVPKEEEEEEEWQHVPEEWLNGEGEEEEEEETHGGGETEQEGEEGADNKSDVGSEGDNEEGEALSELSELTESEEENDEDEEQVKPQRSRTNGKSRSRAKATKKTPAVKKEEEPAEPESLFIAESEPMPPLPDGFVEWETIAITLHEWEHVADPWENATHYLEKALYKTLTKHIVPVIVEELKAVVQKRQLEDAVVHRKRSARIAVKESEKEAIALETKKKTEEEVALTRAQRLEQRQRREEDERTRRERAREERELRKRERDDKGTSSAANTPIDIGTPEAPPQRESGTIKLTLPPNGNRGGAGGHHQQEWELSCELCFRQGVNMDGHLPLVACSLCNRRQHIQCHDRADHNAGRAKRNWVAERFACQRCRLHLNRAQTMQSGASPQLNGVTRDPRLQAQQAQQQLRLLQQVAAQQSNNTSIHSPATPLGAPQGWSPQMSRSPYHSQTQPYPGHTGMAFAHYQPQQRGFSSSPHPQHAPMQMHQPRPDALTAVENASRRSSSNTPPVGQQFAPSPTNGGAFPAFYPQQQQGPDMAWNAPRTPSAQGQHHMTNGGPRGMGMHNGGPSMLPNGQGVHPGMGAMNGFGNMGGADAFTNPPVHMTMPGMMNGYGQSTKPYQGIPAQMNGLNSMQPQQQYGQFQQYPANAGGQWTGQ